jgi:hypothetical protein
VSGPHLVSTEVSTRPCQRCGGAVVAAYSEGVYVQCDLTPLDVGQEIAVLVAGRVTYDLLGLNYRELALRDGPRLTRREYPVLPEHDCPLSTVAEMTRRRPYRRST